MDVESGLRTERNLPVDRSTTSPPDHNIHLATRRISQFEGQFESPTRHFSRRSFLRMLGLGVVGIATGTAAYALLPRNDASAATTPPTAETNKEPLNLTAAEVFGNNVTTEAELRKTPDDIRDFKLVTDTQGNVSEIIALKNTQKGKYVYRVMLDSQKGTFRAAFQTTRTPLSFEAESVVKVGRKIVIGGQTEWSSDIPVLLQSTDSVRPFEPISVSSTTLSRIMEMNQVPNSSKVILMGGSSLVILDLDSGKIVETSGKSGGLGVTITSESADNQTAAIYSLASNGLSRDLLNLSTGQVLENQLYFKGVYVDGYDFKKDTNNKPTYVLVTDNENERDLVQDLATNIITSTSYQALFDKIPVAKKSMLLLRSVSIVNDWIWEAGQFTDGEGSGGVVVFVRPFYSNLNINAKDVAVYVIIKELSGMPGGISQQGFKRGIFGGLSGHLLNIEEYGVVFIPSNQDGSPIAGATPTHLGIKDNPPPIVNIPVVLDALR